MTVKVLSTVPDNIDPELIRDGNPVIGLIDVLLTYGASPVIVVPGIKIPFAHAGEYAFGIGLDENTTRQIEAYKPTCVHFTVPDFVALDGIKWCQKNNIAYIGKSSL